MLWQPLYGSFGHIHFHFIFFAEIYVISQSFEFGWLHILGLEGQVLGLGSQVPGLGLNSCILDSITGQFWRMLLLVTPESNIFTLLVGKLVSYFVFCKQDYSKCCGPVYMKRNSVDSL